ncbi:hypothetical protein OIV83_003380 [Microbotryomycetes sp. JL201]|nr:hypothetical protein OIV83_003380 [Microbotryomycetes sp. JL201]
MAAAAILPSSTFASTRADAASATSNGAPASASHQAFKMPSPARRTTTLGAGSPSTRSHAIQSPTASNGRTVHTGMPQLMGSDGDARTRGSKTATTTAGDMYSSATSHDMAMEQSTTNKSQALALAAAGGGEASTHLSRSYSASSAHSIASASKKAPSGQNSAATDGEEHQRQQAVDKVLKRTQAAKLARTFRNRIALASFKAQRGWQNADLGSIESHLHQSTPAVVMHQSPMPLPFPQAMPPPVSSYGGTMYPQSYATAAPAYQPHATPQSAPYASTSTAPYSAPPSQPYFGEPQHRQKRRMTISDATGRDASPQRKQVATTNANRVRATSLSQSGSNNHYSAAPIQQRLPSSSRPLSSSDPTFSSFVDAAQALTGMSRGPSDHSVLSGEDERASPGTARQTARPGTPDQDRSRVKGQGLGESSAEGAAELMLFLAASPSPVQTSKTTSTTVLGGDGAPLRGRRLFSGADGPTRADADKPMTPSQGSTATGTQSTLFGSQLAPPMSTSTSMQFDEPDGSQKSRPFANEDVDGPSKTSLHYGAVSSSALGNAPLSAATSIGPTTALSSLPPMPSTPGRDRQASGSGWEHFLNVSPSPQRPTFDRSAIANRDKLLDHDVPLHEAGPSPFSGPPPPPTSSAALTGSAPFATTSTTGALAPTPSSTGPAVHSSW